MHNPLNRPMRTRMSGGVAGMSRRPLPPMLNCVGRHSDRTGHISRSNQSVWQHRCTACVPLFRRPMRGFRPHVEN